MIVVDPRVSPALVPEGSRAIIIAEHQPEYKDLPSIRTPNGYVITRWTMTEDERKAVANGEDVYVTLLSNGPINPIHLSIGTIDWTK